MTFQETIKQKLAELKPELYKRFFVDKIGLFGSINRSDFGAKSDIDIIVEFAKPVGVEFIDLADYLEEKLKHKVDLVSMNGVKKNLFSSIKNSIVYV